MSVAWNDVGDVVTLLLSIPLLVVWGFTLFDISRRPDLPRIRKVVYAVIVVLVFPAALLYLFSRPTSIVRHRDRNRPDWRSDLLARLETPPGGRPAVGPRQEEQLLERVDRLRTPTIGP